MTSTSVNAPVPTTASVVIDSRPPRMGTDVGLPTRPPSLIGLIAGMAPLAVFLSINSAWGLVPAILASTAAAASTTLARLRSGSGIGWLSLALLAYVLLRGAAGALTGSHQVFFGISLAGSATVATAVLATAFTGRPVAAYLLPTLMGGRLRPATVAHPTYRRISAQITGVWAAAELAVTAAEAWHLHHADAVEFVATRALIGWPAMATVVFLCAFYARFRIEWLQGPPTSSSTTAG